MRRNSTDDEILALERLADEGDQAAAVRLEAMKARLESPFARAVRLAAEKAVASHVGRVTDIRLSDIEAAARRGALAALGHARLPRGGARIIREAAQRVYDSFEPERRAVAEAAALAEQARIQAHVALLRQRATRVFGLADLRDLLERAEGTARQRTLSAEDLVLLVLDAREAGRATVAAPHDVARSYSYPVSYTEAEAYLDEPTGDVVIRVARTQTWGRRADTDAVGIVGPDLFIGHANPSDEDLRDLERHELTDPVASRKARELRIRLGQARPSDLILEQLPEAARIAFDNGEDWSDPIYLPSPSFAPGASSELMAIIEPEGPGSPPEFYRRYYEECYEVESPRWSYKGRPAVIGETHVYSESNGIWDSLGSDERRDVDKMTIEDMYGPAPSGHQRSPDTRWLDRRMWMRSWEPYDEHVLDTGEDPIGAYGLDDATDLRRLARCRLRALMWSFTTPEEYFALVGEAGLRWCSERSGQWHHHNPSRNNSRGRR